jgi:2-keto-4-pentenoate hydratase
MTNARLRIAFFVIVSVFLGLAACISPQRRVASAVLEARGNNEALPLPHVIDETLTIAAAYRIQKRLVEEVLDGAQPAGFKAGLTSLPAQKRFHAEGPVAGVLMPWGLRHSGDTLDLSDLRGLHIETEVAFRIGTAIREPLATVDEMKRHVDGIAPAVELPDLDYATSQQLNAVDIVATNVAAAAFILGEFAAPDSRDPNEVAPQLICNDALVNAGNARDALGDQWQAALWLVNKIVEQGWSVEAGQVLMTGALGRMVPAQAAQCTATFGKWGTIELRVVP